ncbi:MAG: amino acid permease, partial [Bacteroidaceae bacterium]
MAKIKKFGTFGGVFTPSLLTILGVIMYLRLGWVIGNAGSLLTTIGIILIAHIVSVSTGLSISSIATDKKVKSGGIYYILSRSLGLSIGGAIGITLYLATALSISLYLIGFSESVLVVLKDTLQIQEITINHLRLVATIALFVITTIAYISTSFAIKTQYLILLAIVLSLISVFLGTSEGKGFDFSDPNLVNAPGFAVIFGVFFPAVTGFTAGVAMSGDLKDPKKSIPWGTMLSICVGLVVYTCLAVFLFYSIPGAELQNNNNALVEFSWMPQLVIAGIWGATLSSALGGILGGPRIMQSMSNDKITPHIFGKGVGPGNEPRNALVLTFVLAEAGILIGELNVIAGIVAMFYMAAYMFINLSCFLEKWASPDFRPKFKIPILIPFIGTIAILLLMIQLNLIATLASVLIMGGIFVLLTKKQLELSSGNVWSSVWSSVVKIGLENLDKKPINKRNWEPNILLFSGKVEARPHLIAFSKAVSGRGGMISNFDLLVNPSATTLFPKQKQAQEQDKLSDDIVFYRKQECKDLFLGVEAIASTYGFSGIEPNTILMGWARNTEDPIGFATMNARLIDLEYNILYLDYDKKKGFGAYAKIDIWWENVDNVGDLTLQIVKRILLSNDWNNAEVRILCVNNHHQKNTIEKIIRRQLMALRLDFPFQIINNEVDKRPFYKIVQEYSSASDLIVMKIPKMEKGEEAIFVQKTNDFLGEMGTILLISSSKSYDEEMKDSSYLENKYDEKRYVLDLKTDTSMVLKPSGCDELD